ncbi:Mediator of RNA polymerase II transcription subunit 7 [Coemansia sp. RSA 1358]|uniref:Mediator of RNA polymerase II transcription subunit 7 n=1 Tax=Coemansia umbellata TaxID=1424467 RepID=A0ABQ8PIA6_9FUNG|nr:Mediator of RNA polymerase II transcription subunit 7 [Coemansia umbellata]KAJ2619789.1 Mediator of RNA polymerase II transcription subunit 7 [Coemansia sp. RSA 1358]
MAMQDQAQQAAGQQLDALYPAPPDYYSLFTDANVERATSSSLATVLDDHELRFLVPPPPPSSGSYTMFGRTWQVNDRLPTLAEQQIPQLYPNGSIDRVAELKKLNHSVIFEFLELVDVLIKDPSQYDTQTDRLRDIFVNAHHLINEYRDHQAKETLKMMLRQQIDNKRQATEATLAKCEELKTTIESLKQEALDMETRLNPATEATEKSQDFDNEEEKGDHWSKDGNKIIPSVTLSTSLKARLYNTGMKNITASIQALT